MRWVELARCDDFCELFHVRWFNIHDVYRITRSDVIVRGNPSRLRQKRVNVEPRTKTLVTDVQIPQIDSKVVSGYVCLLVRINRDGMYMIRMCIRVDFARDGSDDVVLLHHTWQAKMSW
jgi:hypothetical protein